MKIHYCTAAIFSTLLLVKSELSSDEKRQAEECIKEIEMKATGLSDNPNLDIDKNCLLACVMAKEGVMDNGKIVVENVIEEFAKNKPEKVKAALKEILNECTNKANEEQDDCKVIDAYYKCIMEKK